MVHHTAAAGWLAIWRVHRGTRIETEAMFAQQRIAGKATVLLGVADDISLVVRHHLSTQRVPAWRDPRLLGRVRQALGPEQQLT